jgi:outer membrane lipoprotein-sorting protein
MKKLKFALVATIISGLVTLAAQTSTANSTAPSPSTTAGTKQSPKKTPKKAPGKKDATGAASTSGAVAAGKTESEKPAAAGSGDQLETVLTQMDQASDKFSSAEADFVWDQFQKVVEETDTQKGHVYFVRHDKDMHMAANVEQPDKKQIIFTDGKIRFYQPRIDQVTEYDAGKNKAEVESFLVLGFGGRGHDLPKQFEVRLDGYEDIAGVKTAKLELVPKSDKIKNMFNRMILWVDTSRGVSMKQQAFEPAGDYRIAVYSNFKLNGQISADTFKLRTTAKTKVVKP